MDIRLAAIDLDGTLLDDQKRVSANNLNALEELLERGVIVALVTARDCASIQLKVPLSRPGLFLLGSGGALIYKVETKSIIWEKYLPPELVEEGSQQLKTYGYPVFLNSVNDYWVDRYNERVEMIEERYNLTTNPFQDANEIQQPIMRVSLAAPAQILNRAAQEAGQVLGDRMTVSLASPDWLDLLAFQAGKGPALEKLQAILGISSIQTLVIGDYDCDLDLFAHAKQRVAMGNAVPAVKAASTFITGTNNEDGVAQALERIL
jgi:Cof subfamily protein (haloacid dehalogenase superfamily)